MVPGFVFFVFCVIVVIGMLFVFKGMQNKSGVKNLQLDNLLSIIKSNLNYAEVDDFTFRQITRQAWALLEGTNYPITAQRTSDQMAMIDAILQAGKHNENKG